MGRIKTASVIGVVALLAVVAALYALTIETDQARADNGVPGKPGNLRGESVREGVKLAWDDPSDGAVTGYQILRRRPLEGEKSLLVYVDDTGSTRTGYTDTGVEDGTTYVYRVKARNGDTLGASSNFVRLVYTEPVPDDAPAAPRYLRAEPASDGVLLSWLAPAEGDVTGYRILRRRPEEGEAKLEIYEENTGNAETRWVDTDAVVGTVYVYRVKALNEDTAGQQSNFQRLTHRSVKSKTPTFRLITVIQRINIRETTVGAYYFHINNLRRDKDADTIDVVMRADVFDEEGEDADECEDEGAGLRQYLSVVDEDVETLTAKVGSRDYDCVPGDYVIKAIFWNADETEVTAYRREFKITGPTTVVIE